VELHLWRGAYTIQAPALRKIDGQIKRPFIEAKDIDLSVEWRALLHGALVATFEFDELRVNIVAGPSKDKEQLGIDTSALQKLRDLFPLRIDKLVVNDGEIHYGDPWGKPPFDIYLDDIQAVARNLTNSEKISKTLVATLAIKGRAMHSGHFTVNASIDPYAKKPTFDLELVLRGLRLQELNEFLKDSLAVEAKDGTLALFAEVSVKEDKLKGYVKPLVERLDIVDIKPHSNVLEELEGFGVQLASALFRNRPHERIGAKIEFGGSLEKPDISVWQIIGSLLSNAFVQALAPKLDEDVAKKADQEKTPADGKADHKVQESQEKTKEEVNKKVQASNKKEEDGKK
jgi:hypothetical protein